MRQLAHRLFGERLADDDVVFVFDYGVFYVVDADVRRALLKEAAEVTAKALAAAIGLGAARSMPRPIIPPGTAPQAGKSL